MKKMKILIISVIVVISIGVLITLNIIKSGKETKENIKIINDEYALLLDNVKSYNDIRSKYIKMSANFFLETYKDKHNDYLELLDEYNDTISKIDKNVIKIDKRCNRLYKDSDINNICSNYKKIYEKLINLYVTDLNNYNENLKKYNEYKNDSLELYDMIHDNYIDYNNDGIYEGRDSSEKN